MAKGKGLFAVLTALGLGAIVLYAAPRVWDFESTPVGQLPKGWKVGVTNADTLPLWKVTAEGENHVLTMARPAKKGGLFGIGSVFNLCYTDTVQASDLDASVRFKAVSGREDRGGGIMWRVKSDGTYYVARFNPLEENFRFYYVKDGRRVELAGTHVRLKPGWHTMRIVMRGEAFEGYLDGRGILRADDDTIEGAGGVGLWTKADAVTKFDDFRIEALR